MTEKMPPLPTVSVGTKILKIKNPVRLVQFDPDVQDFIDFLDAQALDVNEMVNEAVRKMSLSFRKL